MRKVHHLLNVTRSEPADEGDRVVRFTASTGNLARDGGIVEPSGWSVDQYLTNPVFLWNHNDKGLPIGRAISVEKTKDALVIEVEFAGEEQSHPFAETVYRLYRSGFLNAVSTGMRVVKDRLPTADEKQRGVKWVATNVELYELSAVPLPADPGAIATDRRLPTALSGGLLRAQDVACVKRNLGAIEPWANLVERAEDLMQRNVNESEVDFFLALRDPSEFDAESFEQVQFPQEGEDAKPVVAVVGALVDGGEAVQALRFPKDAGWTQDDADAWVEANAEAVANFKRADEPEEEKPDEERAEDKDEDEENAERADFVAQVRGALQQVIDLIDNGATERADEEPAEGDDEEEDKKDVERRLRTIVREELKTALSQSTKDAGTGNRGDTSNVNRSADVSDGTDLYATVLDLVENTYAK